jgi:hypothetical protein
MLKLSHYPYLNRPATSATLPVSFMARCSKCDAETELHIGGVPVCLRCEEQFQPPALFNRGNRYDLVGSSGEAPLVDSKARFPKR